MKLFKRCSLLVLSLAFSMSIMSGTASAASDYDNLLRTSPVLYVHTDGYTKSKKMDISDSWWAEFKQVYAKRILQGHSWPSNFVSEFEDIVQNGGRWGIATYEDSTGALIEIYGTHDPDAYCGFVGSASTGSYQCASNPGYGFVRASVFVHNSYANMGCTPVNSISSCSETGMNIYAAPEVISETAGYTFLQMPNWALEDYPFFFMNFDLNYPVGYEGVLIPQEAPNPKYVAMGDSFSSGEGNPPFEAGTDISSNTCHRSPAAWPRLVQFGLGLGTTKLVACSGAISDNIIESSNLENLELPQAVYVSEETEVVTISIGGNDVGFGNVLTICTKPTEEEGTTEEKHEIEHDACVAAIDDARDIATSSALQTKLEAVFSGLRDLSWANENLQLIVVGYPNLLPTYDDIVGSCLWGNGELNTSGRDVASDEVSKSRSLHDELNATIEEAVDATNDENIHFVDPSSEFVGHELCRPTPWFNNVVPHAFDEIGRRMSYHPNVSGQTAYATAVEAEVNNFLLSE